MKKITLLLLSLFCLTAAMAQSQAAVDAAVAKFQNFYNHQQTDSIYNMLSGKAKGLMPLEKTRSVFTQLTSQLGDLKTYQLTKTVQALSFYKATFSNATLSLIVAVNKDQQLETFRFVPYKEDTTPVTHEVSNFVLKTTTGNIYGTLTLPDGAAKVPVVLIIAGSGPTDRNCNSAEGVLHCDAYKMLADSLKLAGIACVRYDKRGVGESKNAVKNEDSLRFDDYVNDAAGFIRMLREDARFSNVIVLGHSEGSLIGMLAARKEKAAAYISVAGIAEKIDKVVELQLNAQSADLAAKATIILDSMKAGYFVKDVDTMLLSLFRPSIQPYMMSWLKYEPGQEIKKLRIPVLILQGTTDIQVRMEEAEALKKAYPKATLQIIPGMNHPLKQAPEDREQNVATYTNPNLPLSPGLMPAITGFIAQLPAAPKER